jgi:hypothetical protein
MLVAAAVLVVAVHADHSRLLHPLADFAARVIERKEGELKTLAAKLAAAKTPNGRRAVQEDIDEAERVVKLLRTKPAETLASTHAQSPFGHPPGTLLFAYSESVTPTEITADAAVLSVLSFADGSGSRRPVKSEGRAIDGRFYGGTKPVLDAFTVAAKIPGLKKGTKTTMSGWYLITESGGTKDEPTATGVPFKFGPVQVALLQQLVAAEEAAKAK